MELAQAVVAVTTTGGAGVSAGTAKTPALQGYLEDIFVDWDGTAPATSDITISFVGPARGNVWALANSATDAFVVPRVKPVDNANAAITNAYERFALNGPLLVTVAQSNDLAPAVTVYVRYWRTG